VVRMGRVGLKRSKLSFVDGPWPSHRIICQNRRIHNVALQRKWVIGMTTVTVQPGFPQ
jgi:hypothetical protein